MATFLDVTGLQHFSNFFVFLFVWLVVWAILGYTKILGENRPVQVVLGLIIALLALLSPTVTGAIAYISPWFALLFVVLIFIIAALKVFGATSADIASFGQLKVAFVAFVVLIFVIGIMSYVREQSDIPTGEDVDYTKTASVIFHPKVLGIVFVLLIAVFTIVLMAAKQT